MLKLTSSAGYRGSIYIAAAHITVLQGTENGTKIWLSGGNVDTVQEKACEILAMPEMICAMNPLYQVTPRPINQLAEALKAESIA